MAERILLKSWAMLPVSIPMVSSFAGLAQLLFQFGNVGNIPGPLDIGGNRLGGSDLFS